MYSRITCMLTTRALPLHAPRSSVVMARSFSSTSRWYLNPLLNLSGLASSKEAHYLSKERRIPREEYFPHLHLIRSSEVDPFAPAAGASPTVIAALRRAERGESDMQTAYSLAISNLVTQLETSRREARSALQSLAHMEEKYRTQEKHALLMVTAIIAFISILVFKPDTMDLVGKEYASLKESLVDFDWLWLGNPPKYVSGSSQHLSKSVATVPASSEDLQFIDLSLQSGNIKENKDVSVTPGKSTSTRPSLARLFWAPSYK